MKTLSINTQCSMENGSRYKLAIKSVSIEYTSQWLE